MQRRWMDNGYTMEGKGHVRSMTQCGYVTKPQEPEEMR